MRSLFLAALLLSPPALADVVDDTEDTDTEDTSDDKGCSVLGVGGTSLLSLALAGALLRRRPRTA